MYQISQNSPKYSQRNRGYREVLIEAESIEEAYRKIQTAVYGEGKEITDERGETTLEIRNLMVHLKNPEAQIPADYEHMTTKEAEEYASEFLTFAKTVPVIDKGDFLGFEPRFEYEYGDRIRNFGYKHHKIDQLDAVINKLRKNPHTRRAVIVLWNPLIDNFVEEVPCLNLLSFLLREGKLNLTAVFRSNDMVGAWPANAYALIRLLEYACTEIKTEKGDLTTLSISAHFYSRKKSVESPYKAVKKSLIEK